MNIWELLDVTLNDEYLCDTDLRERLLHLRDRFDAQFLEEGAASGVQDIQARSVADLLTRLCTPETWRAHCRS